jgi:hypothetical protein
LPVQMEMASMMVNSFFIIIPWIFKGKGRSEFPLSL